ncbi:HK97-gp10 family putative phage morphogenesis protein [Lacticaseibacillus paracasei]|uniref:HK97-gp10 family putative phage morphogenesis protein n=1 Tax=Lacticaseibacillus paracasei TaxID=1597 RepID=UPI0005EB3B45|nr:HK97-gp10 family putative phage morphogenesis protein [Lacticaseibacillus paracasei]
MANVTWAGINELIAQLELTHEGVVDVAAKAMETTLAKTQERAQSNAPVRTGFLKSNIHVLPVEKKTDQVIGTVKSDADYSSFVEFGTYKMSAKPFMRPAFTYGWGVFLRSEMNVLKAMAKFK